MYTLRRGTNITAVIVTALTTGRSGINYGAVRIALLAALAALAIAATACGGDPDASPAPTPTEMAEEVPTPEPTPPPFIGNVEAIWADDFEGYTDGTFPREGRWQRWKSGVHHMITSEVNAGGAKSFELGRFAQVAMGIPQGMAQASYTAKFMVPSVDEASASPAVMVGLGWKMDDGNVPHASACGVWVGGQLACGGMFLGLAESGKWYEIHVVADLQSGNARYWLDGTDYGEFPLETVFGVPIDNVSHLLIVTGPREVEAYVDELAVFKGEVAPLTASQP